CRPTPTILTATETASDARVESLQPTRSSRAPHGRTQKATGAARWIHRSMAGQTHGGLQNAQESREAPIPGFSRYGPHNSFFSDVGPSQPGPRASEPRSPDLSLLASVHLPGPSEVVTHPQNHET